MLSSPFSQALVLTGPTASGKTTLGIELAQRLDAEIVSMDSMALYRHLDVGTAKPTLNERRLVPHHLVDVLEPWESASVAWWLEQAQRCCVNIEGRGKKVLFVGGTPLYLKALMFGLFDGPAGDAEIRRQLTEEAKVHGSSALHDRLAQIDAQAAKRIHPNDLRRIIRALEVHTLTGQTISSRQTEWAQPQRMKELSNKDEFPAIIWLDRPRPELYERINRRVCDMFEKGLVEETAALRRLGQPLSKEACQAVGYAEVFAHLDGLLTRQQAIEQVQIRSRQFAKRQITWFRHLPGILSATSELTWSLWEPKMKEDIKMPMSV